MMSGHTLESEEGALEINVSLQPGKESTPWGFRKGFPVVLVRS